MYVPKGNFVFCQQHPSPENRIGRIQAAIIEKYPNGVPTGMIE
jgi:hypothetical protein